MNATRTLALLLTAALAARTYGGDAKVTLSSADGTSAFLVRDSNSNELARVQSDGKIGVGTASPTYALDVLGDINLTGTLRTNGVPWNPSAGLAEEADPVFAASAAAGITGTQVGNWNDAFGWGNHASAGYLTAYTETDPVFAASAAAAILAEDMTAWNAKLGGSGTAGYLPKFTASGTVGDSPLFADASGSIGIGTETPAYKLDVAGSLNASAITINGTPVASSTDTYWSTAGSGAIQYSGGSVGVGTATPAASAALDVSATDKGILVPRLTLAQRDAVAAPATGLLIFQTDNTPGFYFFNGTQWASVSAGGAVVSSVSATAPLASSGGSTPTLSLPAASGSASGYLTSADWRAFNAGVPTNRIIATTAPLTGGGALTNNLTLSMPVATASANGYLSSNNWTVFNAKVPTNRIIATTAPLLGGGALTNNLTLAIQTASASQAGALSAADWTTFNNKASAGANSTITSLSGLTTDLSVAQGGTGASTAAAARTNLVAAASGANSDITSLTGLTTDLSVAQGGTGASTLTGVVHGNGTSAMTAGAVALASEVAGTLPVANGGTGASTLTANKILVGNGSSAVLQPTNLHWDNTNSRLGIGDTTPSYALDVAGDVNATGAVRVAGVSIATPAGVIQQFAGAAAPTGYLLCQGQAVSRATYTNLFVVIGTTYGAGNGTTTFNLPNLMGRIPVGYDSTQSEFNVIGEAGGEKTHTLTTAEMPTHSHGITDPGHTHSYDKTINDSNGPFGDNSTEQALQSNATSKNTTGITINNAGGNGAHNNLQPYIVVNYIIKY